VWKTSPGACELEPPVANRGPCSTTRTSEIPSSARWYAVLLPTMPAPMIKTWGLDFMVAACCVYDNSVCYTQQCASFRGCVKDTAGASSDLIRSAGGPDRECLNSLLSKGMANLGE